MVKSTVWVLSITFLPMTLLTFFMAKEVKKPLTNTTSGTIAMYTCQDMVRAESHSGQGDPEWNTAGSRVASKKYHLILYSPHGTNGPHIENRKSSGRLSCNYMYNNNILCWFVWLEMLNITSQIWKTCVKCTQTKWFSQQKSYLTKFETVC